MRLSSIAAHPVHLILMLLVVSKGLTCLRVTVRTEWVGGWIGGDVIKGPGYIRVIHWMHVCMCA